MLHSWHSATSETAANKKRIGCDSAEDIAFAAVSVRSSASDGIQSVEMAAKTK